MDKEPGDYKEVADPSSPQQGLVVHQPGWVGRRIGPP